MSVLRVSSGDSGTLTGTLFAYSSDFKTRAETNLRTSVRYAVSFSLDGNLHDDLFLGGGSHKKNIYYIVLGRVGLSSHHSWRTFQALNSADKPGSREYSFREKNTTKRLRWALARSIRQRNSGADGWEVLQKDGIPERALCLLFWVRRDIWLRGRKTKHMIMAEHYKK